MYRRCIFCSAGLGANPVLEDFPVGRSLAFDAWKGRLWAVCPRCERWNLAPIEERWEAVESAEKIFRDARLRVQSENIGLARLPDGTRLVRVGEALPGEIAAWRYGGELRRRRRRFLGRMAGYLALADVGLILMFDEREERHRAVLHRVRAAESPSGEALEIRAGHLQDAQLSLEPEGVLSLRVPRSAAAPAGSPGRFREGGPPHALRGEEARSALARGLVHLNARGASRREVESATVMLARGGSAEACLAAAVGAGGELPTVRFRRRFWRLCALDAGPLGEGRALDPAAMLAFEMALHEESERRALAGDLAALEAAWRRAEEIAAIADRLPDDPLESLSRGPG